MCLHAAFLYYYFWPEVIFSVELSFGLYMLTEYMVAQAIHWLMQAIPSHYNHAHFLSSRILLKSKADSEKEHYRFEMQRGEFNHNGQIRHYETACFMKIDQILLKILLLSIKSN